MIFYSKLNAYLRDTFKLDWNGVHGPSHWARVNLNAKLLAQEELKRDPLTPIFFDVLKLFSLLHDHQRWDDMSDPYHGARAAQLVKSLYGDLFEISEEEVILLEYAMRYHSDGLLIAHPTVQICWDADRLDLGRVGTKPHPAYLCTETAQHDVNFIKNAYERSIN